MKLAVTARLWTLVAEERPGIAELHRKGAAVETVFDDRPHHPGRALRAQRDRPVAPVGEGVHLLGHHVGGLTHSAGEQRGVLEDRQFDVAVAGPTGRAQQAVAHRDEFG